MSAPITASIPQVRAYCQTLFDLWAPISLDPLNEAASEALILHIVNNRRFAAYLMQRAHRADQPPAFDEDTQAESDWLC